MLGMSKSLIQEQLNKQKGRVSHSVPLCGILLLSQRNPEGNYLECLWIDVLIKHKKEYYFVSAADHHIALENT